MRAPTNLELRGGEAAYSTIDTAKEIVKGQIVGGRYVYHRKAMNTINYNQMNLD